MKMRLFAPLLALLASPAFAQHEGHDGMAEPVAEPGAEPGGDLSAEAPMPADHMHSGAMTGALGPYPATREASGTAWQPETSPHAGAHAVAGRWSLMGHVTLFGVYDRQAGPRGGEKAFVSGMAMGMARRPLGPGTLQLRAGFSPDPLMGRRGFPLLLASGETADGVTPLIDRQHPHDLFMELSASFSLPLSGRASLFAYAGLPGEPAFGPPPFMHRLSALESPEAAISHHWLDSTHISFGVITAGIVAGDVKLEGSRFNGREPDQHRFDIETGPLDSTALRLSWNPARSLSLQASWARLIDTEQLEPGEDQTRWSASALYNRSLGRRARWATTLAWGRRSREHGQLDAFLLESAVTRGPWTLFGRAERTENDELAAAAGHRGPVYRVGKVSLGGVRDFRAAAHVRLGVGGLWAFNFVPAGLEPSYAGDRDGAMLFLRVRID
ncbi:MAG: hypothetical protein QOJ91_2297 [Sphingomonadales bacterium]|jgi:hypothetical protein|nr:hypothetical protein [Sphingomonadales bacterium]